MITEIKVTEELIQQTIKRMQEQEIVPGALCIAIIEPVVAEKTEGGILLPETVQKDGERMYELINKFHTVVAVSPTITGNPEIKLQPVAGEHEVWLFVGSIKHATQSIKISDDDQFKILVVPVHTIAAMRKKS